MELQCTKEEGYLPSLTYLDTAHGISPIMEKLPYGLQEKWVSDVSRFKEENDGHFSPFDFFAKFSFILPSSSSGALGKPDRPTELHVFSDVCMKAIGVVVYLRAKHKGGQTDVGFFYGKGIACSPFQA